MTYEDAFSAVCAERDMWRDKYLALQQEFNDYLKHEIVILKQTEPTQPAPIEERDEAYPREGKYSEVRLYIEQRKRHDAEFKRYCQEHTLRNLCGRLSREFGWFVDEHSLGANLNRNRYAS